VKLKPEQEAMLRRQSRASFEAQVLAHLRKHLAERVAGLSEMQLIERIREGVTRAATYGLESPRQVVCFIDTTFLLGRDFDLNPVHAWAQKTLASKALQPSDRAALLLATACSVAGQRAIGQRDV
jgi:hypothetical protein